MEDKKIERNTLSIIGLAQEFCVAVENASTHDREEFIAIMLKLLPRLYIAVSDAQPADDILSEDEYALFANYVEEDYYESVRRNIEMLLGPDDVFLETFEEDMKYSDTPIAASVSESLADIFQDLFNFLAVVKNSEGLETDAALRDCKDNFEQYWAQKVCNVMRPLNRLRFK